MAHPLKIRYAGAGQHPGVIVTLMTLETADPAGPGRMGGRSGRRRNEPPQKPFGRRGL